MGKDNARHLVLRHGRELSRRNYLREHLSTRVEKTDGCWVWRGRLDPLGYGIFKAYWGCLRASRIAWFVEYGKWPKDCLDHLCRNVSCVRPSHLDDVPNKINILRGVSIMAINARKTHCRLGHPLKGSNLYSYTTKSGKTSRHCKICDLYKQRRYYADGRRFRWNLSLRKPRKNKSK